MSATSRFCSLMKYTACSRRWRKFCTRLWRTTNWTSSSARGRRHAPTPRSEEHTSELQSRLHLVCRLLLEKKKNNIYRSIEVETDNNSMVVIENDQLLY